MTRTSKNTSDGASPDEVERIKLDLLSLVSHELRTPLTGVLNALRVLQDEELSLHERKSMLEMALRNAEKLNTTLSQLLDLSKLVSGRLVCRFQELSLRTVFAGALERFQAEVAVTGRTLATSVTPSVLNSLPVVMGDGRRIDGVLASLTENALRFSPERSCLELGLKCIGKVASLPRGVKGRLSEASSYVVFELKNSVPSGSLSADHDVFKIFSQQEGVLDRVHEGVGGSLAIGAEVLRQHGGALHAEISGDQFVAWLVLPVLEGEQALLKVLESRMYALRTELGAISLMILELNVGEAKLIPRQIHEALKSALFRASDTVYGFGASGQVAVLMDDCKKEDAPKIVARLLKSIGAEAAKFLEGARVGLASFPDDGTDPVRLLEQARHTLAPIKEF